MLDGKVYILSKWDMDQDRKFVSGDGKLLNINRDLLAEGHFSIPLDSVAIFETNLVQTSPSVGAMGLVTGASVALTIYYIVNPKACFGSCPTFYVEDGEDSVLQAEGFSSSVSPSLEASDIDALYRAKPNSREFKVIMKNEALETHVVRYVELLAVKRPEGGRVFATGDGVFWQAKEVIEPSLCEGPEGDCLSRIRAFDGLERISQADSTYLGTKETIELEFEDLPNSRYGLVIAARQSLLSTYLFYQTLAYMGSSASDWFALLESGDSSVRKRITGIGQILGGVEIFVKNKNEWKRVGELSETGPLATDVRIAPLPDLSSGYHKISLRLTKGHWRIDYIALASMDKEVTPIELQAQEVYHNLNPDSIARESLLDTSKVLITLPGDVYTLTYSLPEDFKEYELFLKTRGYYLEWIRDEWLSEEDQEGVAMIFLNPEKALRKLAPEYKKIEADMEKLFWGSKYAR
jgi:hypothetical protein